MDLARILAGGLAVNRVAFGANYLVRPKSAGQSWIGRAARMPGTQVIVRSQGARDVALVLARSGRSRAGPMATRERGWRAHAVADGADVLATWVARDRLPKRQARLALSIAAGSTAVALLGAACAAP